MKLVEDIQKAEEKAEKLKKKAETEGQKLLEDEREHAKKELAALDEEREKLLEKSLQEAKTIAHEETKNLQKEYDNERGKLQNAYKKNKEKAAKKVQEIIIKWPSSQ